MSRGEARRKKKAGRPTLFGKPIRRVQGYLDATGSRLFDAARAELVKESGKDAIAISESNVMNHVLRRWDAARELVERDK